MNNKEQQPEPLAAILAEMRASSLATVRDWADRIDAEANKMRAMLDANIARVRKLEAMLDGAANTLLGCAIKQKESVHGNAAAMRDLLEKIRREYCDGLISCQTCVSSDADVERVSRLFYEGIDAALASPTRNCDRPECATAEEAYAAWQKHNSLTAICDWLFAPAEGGAE